MIFLSISYIRFSPPGLWGLWCTFETPKYGCLPFFNLPGCDFACEDMLGFPSLFSYRRHQVTSPPILFLICHVHSKSRIAYICYMVVVAWPVSPLNKILFLHHRSGYIFVLVWCTWVAWGRHGWWQAPRKTRSGGRNVM